MQKTGFLQSVQLPGLWIDALVVDPDKRLLFLSAWGNDSVIANTRARFSLPPDQGGLSNFQLTDGPTMGGRDWVSVEQPHQYEQITGRSGPSLFLHLTHLWMYSRLADRPDQANAQGLLFRRKLVLDEKAVLESKAQLKQQLWRMIQQLSPVPLHASWDTLVVELWNIGCVKQHRGFNLEAWTVSLEEKTMRQLVTTGMRQGRLTLPPIH